MKTWRRLWLSGILVLLTLLAGASVGHAVTYNYQTVEYPGSEGTVCEGISNTNQIVGHYQDGCGYLHGFLLSGIGGTFTPIDVSGALSTVACGINTDGDIVGWYVDTSGYHGFYYDGTTYTTLDATGAEHTWALAINSNGDIVGYYKDSSGSSYGYYYDGIDYTAINISGTSTIVATGINSGGDIVGYYKDSSGKFNGFLLSSGVGGTLTTFDYPGYSSTEAWGINTAGHIVGSVGTDPNWHGFLWDGADYYKLIDYPSASYTRAYGVNDSGLIVGYYYGSKAPGFLATPILMDYDFSCYYNDGAGDSYAGSFYDYDTYAVGDTIPFTDENGQPGYYEITGLTPATDGVDGQVFVDTYYDLESDNFYTPLHAGTVVGDASLGSERDYLLLDHYILNRFGIGPEGAEEVHYEADVTYAQDVYNRHREPFRTIRLNSLHRCYLLLGTRHPELFDDDV